jgi:hypothetical protein
MSATAYAGIMKINYIVTKLRSAGPCPTGGEVEMRPP